jgi:hypothetical protein
MINMNILISILLIGMLLITGLTATATPLDKIVRIKSQGILELTKINQIESQIENTLKSFESSDSKTIFVDDNNTAGPWNGTEEYPYKMITDALNNASDGDTVNVKSGIYIESIVVNKSIYVVGEEVGNEGKPVITNNEIGLDDIFLVTLDADFCFFEGFKILCRPYSIPLPIPFVQVTIRSNSTLFLNNDLVNNLTVYASMCWHIYINGNRNIIGFNKIYGKGSMEGIIDSAGSSIIFCNTISACGSALYLEENNSYIFGNIIKNNTCGVEMSCDTGSNFIFGNKIIGNEYGFAIYGDGSPNTSSDFIIFNNITENTNGLILDNVSINNTRVRWNNIYNNEDCGLRAINCTIDARFNWWGSFFGPSRGESKAFGDKIISDNGKIKTFISMPVKNPLVDILYDFCQVVEIE